MRILFLCTKDQLLLKANNFYGLLDLLLDAVLLEKGELDFTV